MSSKLRSSSRGEQSTFETYFREIDSTPLLSADEERSLACRIEDGDGEARDHMVRANLRLVVHLARSYLGRGLPLDDLIEEGNLGLMRAVEGFDPSMSTRFSTYASYWIRQSMKRAVVNTAKTVRLPAYMSELMIKWRRAAAQLQDEIGRTATEEEIATHLGIPKKKLRIIQKAIRIHTSSQMNADAETGLSLDEMLKDERAKTPDVVMSASEDLHEVLVHLDHLGEREQNVLRLRFGLLGDDPKTLKEIGDLLGLTRERVRQIEQESLASLRNEL